MLSGSQSKISTMPTAAASSHLELEALCRLDPFAKPMRGWLTIATAVPCWDGRTCLIL